MTWNRRHPFLRTGIQCSFADARIEIEHMEQRQGILGSLFPLHFQHIPLAQFCPVLAVSVQVPESVMP
jgi:hypothetical protein